MKNGKWKIFGVDPVGPSTQSSILPWHLLYD